MKLQANRIALREIWSVERPLVGMIHLLPLPGSPGWGGSMRAVIDRATADALALRLAGFDGLLIENFGDAPFHPRRVPAAAVAALAVAAAEITAESDLPIGINVLRNDAAAALGVAVAVGARFIRCNVHVGGMWTDQGWVEGRAHHTLRLRAVLGARVAILADVFVKHAVPPPGLTIADAARDTWERGLADALIVTGAATGVAPEDGRFEAVRAAVPGASIWIGSGLSAGDARLARADGAIIGSALQRDGRAGSGVDPERAVRFVRAARGTVVD